MAEGARALTFDPRTLRAAPGKHPGQEAGDAQRAKVRHARLGRRGSVHTRDLVTRGAAMSSTLLTPSVAVTARGIYKLRLQQAARAEAEELQRAKQHGELLTEAREQNRLLKALAMDAGYTPSMVETHEASRA